MNLNGQQQLNYLQQQYHSSSFNNPTDISSPNTSTSSVAYLAQLASLNNNNNNNNSFSNLANNSSKFLNSLNLVFIEEECVIWV